MMMMLPMPSIKQIGNSKENDDEDVVEAINQTKKDQEESIL